MAVATGLLLGTLVFAVIILLVFLIAGPLEFTRVSAPSGRAIVSGMAVTLALAMMEEVGFRAYPLWTLVDRWGIWWAQGVVAVAFSLMHIVYGWSIGSVLLGVFPSALLYGAVAVATRGIACPLGVHVALNLCQRLIGEKGEPLLWHVGMSKASEPMVAALSPVIGCVMLLAAAVSVTMWTLLRAGGIVLRVPTCVRSRSEGDAGYRPRRFRRLTQLNLAPDSGFFSALEPGSDLFTPVEV